MIKMPLSDVTNKPSDVDGITKSNNNKGIDASEGDAANKNKGTKAGDTAKVTLNYIRYITCLLFTLEVVHYFKDNWFK